MVNAISKGIFWVLAETYGDIKKENILAVRKNCDLNGNPIDLDGLNSKDGLTYNHKETWAGLSKSVTKGKAFDYFPRGRVEIKNGKATIWLNGHISALADDIKKLFGLQEIAFVQVREDGSKHYRCHFDEKL